MDLYGYAHQGPYIISERSFSVLTGSPILYPPYNKIESYFAIGDEMGHLSLSLALS